MDFFALPDPLTSQGERNERLLYGKVRCSIEYWEQIRSRLILIECFQFWPGHLR